jgi:hypothetical protein
MHHNTERRPTWIFAAAFSLLLASSRPSRSRLARWMRSACVNSARLAPPRLMAVRRRPPSNSCEDCILLEVGGSALEALFKLDKDRWCPLGCRRSKSDESGGASRWPGARTSRLPSLRGGSLLRQLPHHHGMDLPAEAWVVTALAVGISLCSLVFLCAPISESRSTCVSSSLT